MAEIKSTMELVMERLARLDKENIEAVTDDDSLVKEGMKIAAAYLRGDTEDLQGTIQPKSKTEQSLILEGIVDALLHNIVLPRGDDQQDTAERALQGLLELGKGVRELSQIFGDMKKILNQYLSQRQDLRKQLTKAFSQQMYQMEQSLAEETGMALKVDPAKHPKFQEEWQRIVTDLNYQYGRAIDQYKGHIRQLLNSA